MASAGGLAVVVVNYGSSALLGRNLLPLCVARPDVTVVVVDNFSSDPERERLRELSSLHGWRLLEQDNLGFGVGANVGVEEAVAAGCDHFLLMNPDLVIDPDSLGRLEAAWRDQSDALLSPRIERPDGSVWFGGAALDLRRGRTISRPSLPGSADECPWLSGACLMVGAVTWQALGGFDGDYFLYWEDVDLSFRAAQMGVPLSVCSESRAVHDEGGTQERPTGGALSWDYYYFNIRNRLLFASRNLPVGTQRLWRRQTVRESYRIMLRGNGKRKFLRPRQPALTFFRGLRDGLRISSSRGQQRADERPSLLVVHPSADLYGSDRVALDTVIALVEKGWRVTVSLPSPGPLVDLLRIGGAAVVITPTPVLRKSSLSPIGLVRLAGMAVRSAWPGLSLLRRTEADVVYVSTVTVPLWILLARLSRRPVVCHIHEAEAEVNTAVRTALAAPLLLCSSVMANSAFSLRVLTESLPSVRRRACVVTNPVPGPPHPIPARQFLEEPFRLLYLGRLSPRKGPHLLVEAVGLLREAGVVVTLDLVGSVFEGYEWYEAELRARITELGLGSAVQFAGFRRDVWPSIAAADVVVVPSVAAEPFGNTAVEAVLGARPTVVSDSGGLPEAVHGFGCTVIVPVDDVEGILAGILRIHNSWPAFTESAAHDALVAADRHSAARYGETVDRMLRSQVAKRGDRRPAARRALS